MHVYDAGGLPGAARGGWNGAALVVLREDLSRTLVIQLSASHGPHEETQMPTYNGVDLSITASGDWV